MRKSFAAVVLALVLFASACSSSTPLVAPRPGPSEAQGEESARVLEGVVDPTGIDLTRLESNVLDAVTRGEFDDSDLVILTWRATCAPCKPAAVELGRLHDKYPDVVFFSMAVNSTREEEAQFITDTGIESVLHVSEQSDRRKMAELIEKYYPSNGVNAVPAYVVQNDDGERRDFNSWTEGALEERLEWLVAS